MVSISHAVNIADYGFIFLFFNLINIYEMYLLISQEAWTTNIEWFHFDASVTYCCSVC